MTPPINIDGSQVSGITIDGTSVSEVTVDGDVVFSAIPDSVGHQYFATDTGVSDGQTVDPWEDAVGTVDLSAVGSPTQNADGIALDGSDDAYDYGTYNISEPCTVIWAYNLDKTALGSGVATLVEDDGGGVSDTNVFLNGSNDEYGMREMDSTNIETSTASIADGDQIVTLLVDSSAADLRVNGTDQINTSSSADVDVLTSGYGWYHSIPESGRYLPGTAHAVVVHPDTRLSGSSLTDEESRVEEEFGMSVL